MRARFAEHRLTALAYPPLFESAPKIGDTADVTWDGRAVPRINATTRSTTLAPCCGHPGLVVPAGLGEAGLPVGLELDGPTGTDRSCSDWDWPLGPMPAPEVDG